MTQIQPHSPCQNYTEQGVGILMRGRVRLMRKTDDPPVLWYWYLDCESKVKSCTVSPIPRLQVRTPHKHMTG